MIPAGVDGQKLTLANVTGVAILVNDETGGTAANRIRTGTGGQISFGINATLDLIYDSTSARWRVVGGTGGSGGVSMSVERFSGDGVDTTFTLSSDPGSENNTLVYISGVYQQKNTYSVSGTTLTFSVAPASGTNNIEVIIAPSVSIGTPGDNTVSEVKIVDEAVTRSKIDDVERLPIGMVTPFAGTTEPAGWLMCDGRAVSRATYSSLFAIIGETHGQGDNSTTFNLPDYRGRFIRGTDNMGTAAGAASRDPNSGTRTAMATGGNTGNNVGSVQDDAFQGHFHDSVRYASGSGNAFAGGSGQAISGAETPVVQHVQEAGSDGTNGTPRTSSETRPKNAYVNFIIKY
jgi:microcystin-dependent protein